MSVRCVCFDLDGTLVDSRDAIVQCFQEALHDHGHVDVPDEAIAAHIGRPLREMLDGLVDPEAHPPVLAQYIGRFAHWDRRCSTVFEGVPEALAILRPQRELLLITSSKAHRGIVRVLAEHGLDHWFDALWGGDMVERGKPHPEMLQRAMAAVGVDAHETVLVGDTTYDVGMGVSAGVATLGVSWGMHDADQLLQAGARRVLRHPTELSELSI